jgi:hypothetical protein
LSLGGLVGALCLVLPATSLAATAAPSVSTSGVSHTSYSSTILSGYINAHGQPTNFVFQYGTTTGYGGQTPLAPAGSATSTIRVSQTVTGLRPNTTYHYRVIAFGPTAIARGIDRKFVTPKVPLSVAITGVPNPVVFGSAFVVEGALSGTGSANRQVVLQANPFPYTAGFQNVGNPEIATATGGFSFPFVGLAQNAQLRVATVGKPTVYSPVVLENVAVHVVFHVRRTHRPGYAKLYGSVTPAEPGALVGFQRLVRGGRSVNQGGTVVKADSASVSRFSRIVHISRRRRGLYRALVRVGDGGHASNYSSPILIR